MLQLKSKQSGQNPTRLVYTITLLGFSVGVIMVGIIYWTLMKIQQEREQLDAFQVNMTRLVTSLDTHLAQGREDLGALLARKENKNADWLTELSDLIRMYTNLTASENKDVAKAVHQLAAVLVPLQNLREMGESWYIRDHQLSLVFPATRTAVDDSLGKMRAAIIKAEGRQRLRHAVEIRRYHQATGKDALELAREIINNVSSHTNITTVKTEFADLALLCERLIGENQIDNLVNLKDNKFKSTLERLRLGISQPNQQEDSSGFLSIAMLDQFERELFGDAFHMDTVHQTILPGTGGLYQLCREQLILRSEREQLQVKTSRLFDDMRSIRHDLVLKAETIASQTAARAEDTLKRSWETMLTLWLLAMIVFLTLSARIAKTVKRQIKAIETTNENLKQEIEKHKRTQSALLESREALQSAMDGLEIRVEERTYELKAANEQLGNEIFERTKMEEILRLRGEELTGALQSAQNAKQISENERDKSEKILAEVTESKRRLEILLSDAMAREKRILELKREINNLLIGQGNEGKYKAPRKVAEFLAEQSSGPPETAVPVHRNTIRPKKPINQTGEL